MKQLITYVHSKEKRPQLNNLLEISLLRPMKIFNVFKKFPEIFNDLKQNLNITLKSDYEHINKNAFIPYCFWKTNALGQSIGYDLPMCDIFATVMTDSGICYSFNNQ